MARKVISYNKRQESLFLITESLFINSCNAEKEGLGLVATFITADRKHFTGFGN